MSTHPNSLRDLQDQLEKALLDMAGVTAVPELALADEGQPKSPLEAWFTVSDIAEWHAWLRGGSAPQSIGGLELVGLTLDLDRLV
jgi:hypothetical protein